MQTDNLQAQRFELKYRVSESVAAQVRDFVGCHLDYDEYSRICPDHAYFNYSLYLDSDNLLLYWDVINGVMNRYKLRLRYYDDNPDSPVFFEIKQRINDAILKRRCPVKRTSVKDLLSGQLPALEDLCIARPESLATAQEFCRLMARIGATPKAHVAYRREAWMDGDRNSVRVTLDRGVRCVPHFTTDLATEIEGGTNPFAREVVLELKFTERFPVWFRELVQSFDTMQCGCAKYAGSIELAGEEHFRPTSYDPGLERPLAPYLNKKPASAARPAAYPAEQS